MKILVTGSAGFIGFHLANRLLDRGDEVVGYDNLNDYYDVQLKYGRLNEAGIPIKEIEDKELLTSFKNKNYRFVKADLADKDFLLELFNKERFDGVVNLAAQAGVRYSLTNPDIYIKSNIEGFLNLLEACRHYPLQHLVYASSSSVYGANTKMPFSVQDRVDHPVSLYAASKKSNELMAHTYSHLFNIPTTGLRFFTVYGPWGRPDMALFIFTKSIIEGKPIPVFNYGEMKRDFTYIDDIVEGIIRVLDRPVKSKLSAAESTTHSSAQEATNAPYSLYNIGNSSPLKLTDFIEALEASIGLKAKKELLPIQPGDVPATWADVSELTAATGYTPVTDVSDGVRHFVEWYKQFYKI
ncbi:NAD-dependent epimerase [uncultured Pontibacter sp.]|uniref:NAD-dependent epimerase n=1 Tax=uncultured Pontibacter sp. TaxID=453356 RepID=UPI002636C7C0|nr:NAD-dependent epimerase [uncultured Pontibacter sp.]